MTHVILADDHPIFVSALQLVLEDAGIRVLGTASTCTDVLELAGRHEPDAVLLDLSMPGMGGVACIRRLAARHPNLPIVVVSASDDESVIQDALAAGAACYVAKSVQPAELVQALRTVLGAAGGGVRYRVAQPAPELHAVRNRGTDTHGLTKRELEILRLVASGASNGQMAKSLWVTEQTIKFHLSNVYKKLDVPNRTAASAVARRLGLLEAGSAHVAEVVDIASARGVLG